MLARATSTHAGLEAVAVHWFQSPGFVNHAPGTHTVRTKSRQICRTILMMVLPTAARSPPQRTHGVPYEVSEQVE